MGPWAHLAKSKGFAKHNYVYVMYNKHTHYVKIYLSVWNFQLLEQKDLNWIATLIWHTLLEETDIATEYGILLIQLQVGPA